MIYLIENNCIWTRQSLFMHVPRSFCWFNSFSSLMLLNLAGYFYSLSSFRLYILGYLIQLWNLSGGGAGYHSPARILKSQNSFAQNFFGGRGYHPRFDGKSWSEYHRVLAPFWEFLPNFGTFQDFNWYFQAILSMGFTQFFCVCIFFIFVPVFVTILTVF